MTKENKIRYVVSVEGVGGHLPFKEIAVSVLPRIGEVLELEDETWKVTNVIHELDGEHHVRIEVE